MLFAEFGWQGWWPVTAEPGKPPVYYPGKEGRMMSGDEVLEIMVGAVLTQNTSWSNVQKALINLTGEGMMSLDRISGSGGELEALIRPSGYYKQKAARLRAIAQHVLDSGGIGKLRNMETDGLRSLLLSWKGIGPETADAILCYGFSRPVFVVDAYTRRLFEKLEIPSDTYQTMQALVQAAIPPSPAVYGDLHARIVRLFTSRSVDAVVEAFQLRASG